MAKKQKTRFNWTEEVNKELLETPSNALFAKRYGLKGGTVAAHRSKLIKKGGISVQVRRMMPNQVKDFLSAERLVAKRAEKARMATTIPLTPENAVKEIGDNPSFVLNNFNGKIIFKSGLQKMSINGNVITIG